VEPLVLLRAGALALTVLAFPFYSALVARSVNPTLLMVLAGLCASLVNGSFAVLLTDLFPTRVRFSGVALASTWRSRFSAAPRRWSPPASFAAQASPPRARVRDGGVRTARARRDHPASREGGYVLGAVKRMS